MQACREEACKTAITQQSRWYGLGGSTYAVHAYVHNLATQIMTKSKPDSEQGQPLCNSNKRLVISSEKRNTFQGRNHITGVPQQILYMVTRENTTN